MYLSIPIRMEYERIIENDSPRDYFVDPGGIAARIDIQAALKEALRTNKGRQKEIVLRDFTIYRIKPPYVDELFLHYIPNRNGKCATSTEPKMVKGTSFYSNQHTRYGSFWFKELPLDPNKLDEIARKRWEQRENRRHSGDSDSPSPT